MSQATEQVPLNYFNQSSLHQHHHHNQLIDDADLYFSTSQHANHKRKREHLKGFLINCGNGLEGDELLAEISDYDDDEDVDSSYFQDLSTSTSLTDETRRPKSMSRRHHKVLITDEKMAEAIRDLQMDLDHSSLNNNDDQSNSANASSTLVADTLDLQETKKEENDIEEEAEEIVLSDVLKQSFKNYNAEHQHEMRKLFAKITDTGAKAYENMQLVPYKVPMLLSDNLANNSRDSDSETEAILNSYLRSFKSSKSKLKSPSKSDQMDASSLSSSSSSSLDLQNSSFSTVETASRSNSMNAGNAYSIEEPSDEKHGAKNKLKRNYSQVNKINIEEMRQNGDLSSQTNLVGSSILSSSKNNTDPVSFYLVDDESNEETKKHPYVTHVQSGSVDDEPSNAINMPTHGFSISEIVEDGENEVEMDL